MEQSPRRLIHAMVRRGIHKRSALLHPRSVSSLLHRYRSGASSSTGFLLSSGRRALASASAHENNTTNNQQPTTNNNQQPTTNDNQRQPTTTNDNENVRSGAKEYNHPFFRTTEIIHNNPNNKKTNKKNKADKKNKAKARKERIKQSKIEDAKDAIYGTSEVSHLGRAVSVVKISERKMNKYCKEAETFPRRWNMEPETFLQLSKYFEMQGLKDIHRRSFKATVLLEIRDVRIPASSHHPSFTRLARHREHVIIYTHADRITEADAHDVYDWTLRSWPKATVFFLDTSLTWTNAEMKDAFEGTYEEILSIVQDKGTNCALTVGVPNVGKSSFVRMMLKQNPDMKKEVKKKKKLEIQDTPGVTQEFEEYVICPKPRTMMMDVPGITPPSQYLEARPQYWFALLAVQCVDLGGNLSLEIEEHVCDYILFCLNRDRNFTYVKSLQLDRPYENFFEMQEYVQSKTYMTPKKKLSEFQLEKLKKEGVEPVMVERRKRLKSKMFIKLFNTGSFGPCILDDITTKYLPFW